MILDRLPYNSRIKAVVGIVTLTVCVAIGISLLLTQRPYADAEIINLAGRQRMLVQKFAQETLSDLIFRCSDTIRAGASLAPSRETRELFDLTLAALKDGGTTYSDLTMTDEVAIAATSNHRISAQLSEVERLWGDLQVTASVFRSRQFILPDDILLINAFRQSNAAVLTEMDAAVRMFEDESTARLGLFGWMAVGLAVISVLALGWLYRSVIALAKARTRQAFLISAMECVHESILITDRDTKILYVNPGFERITGYRYDEAVGRKSNMLKSGLHSAEFYRAMWSTLKRGQMWSGEMVNRRKNGTLFTEQASIVPILGPSGELTGYVGTQLDISARKEMEKAREESEKRYRTLFEQSPDAILLTDPETTRPIEFNERVFELLGYSRDEFAGLPVSAYEASESPEEIREHVAKVLREGRDTFETIWRTKDGNIRHVLISAQTITLSGRVVFHSIITDITARKQAEEENTELAAFPRENPNCIVVCNLRGDVTYHNPATARLMNQLGLNDTRDLLPENHETTINSCLDGCEGVIPAEVSLGDRIFQWSYHYVVQTNAVHLYGTDVSARKRSENELRRSEARLRKAQRIARLGSWEWNIRTDDFNWSRELHGMFWIEPAQLTRTFAGFLEHVHPDDREQIEKRTQAALAGDTPYSLEHRIIRSDGSCLWIRSEGEVERDGDGNPIRLIGTAQDITAHRQLEEKLSRARRLETAGQLAGQVAHDFNNLLGPLTAYPELIRMRIAPDDKVKGMLADMEHAAEQMVEINQDLLTLGRRGHYSVQAVDVNGILEDTVRTIEVPENITIRTEFARELRSFKGGRAQVTRAFRNLIANAVEAVGQSGSVTVRTSNTCLERPISRYASVRRGEYVQVDISDDGSGIPPEIVERIFEPFFTTKRADRSRGSGLGLSIVHAVVHDHDGYIGIRTQPGNGTTFSIYFPIDREKIDETRAPVTVPADRGRRVLVVDDDPMVLRMASTILKELGYQVTTSSSGEEAVDVITNNPQDIILLDMVMGGIDGTETLRRIKEKYPDQIALIVSGFAPNERVEEAKRIGARGFLPKPFQMDGLRQAIDAALHEQGVVVEHAV